MRHKELVDNVTVIEPLGTSGHRQINFNLIVKTGTRHCKQRIKRTVTHEGKHANVVPTLQMENRFKA